MKKELYTTAKQVPTAVLVAVSTYFQPPQKTEEYLDELEFLADTLGVKVLKRFTQNLDRPDSRTYVGSGRLLDIAAYVKEYAVDLVIFDDDLTSAQVRNIDRDLKEVMVIDRSLLILQIFARRAQTSQAKTQVELAQYQYMLPRLTNLWTHHSRQKGGIGMKGPGESELETDKRIIRDKISLLKDKLAKIERQSFVQRKARERMVRVALVGYTNVGKSTLMRVLSKSDVFAENKLFATVDATVRKVVYKNVPFLLSDTVGFIRKLPTMLVESFKSTLAEITEADLLLHVVDISHEAFEEHIEVVNSTLREIGAGDKPVLLIFNKIDLFRDKEYPPFAQERKPATLEEWKKTYLATPNKAIFISAAQRENIDDLRELIFNYIAEAYYRIYPNHLRFDDNKYWLSDYSDQPAEPSAE